MSWARFMHAQVVCLTYLFLSFIFAVIYHSSVYVFSSLSFDTRDLGLYITHAFHVNDIYL